MAARPAQRCPTGSRRPCLDIALAGRGEVHDRRFVRDGGAIPLAPTKLTDLTSEFEDGRQRRIETEVDRVGREFVLELLVSEDIGPGEDLYEGGSRSLRTFG